MAVKHIFIDFAVKNYTDHALDAMSATIDFTTFIKADSASLGNLKIETGWNYVQGNGTASASKSVSFATTFTNPPHVFISTIGYKTTTPPTDRSSTGGVAYETAAQSVTTTGFSAAYTQGSGTLASTIYVSFEWLAIGN